MLISKRLQKSKAYFQSCQTEMRKDFFCSLLLAFLSWVNRSKVLKLFVFLWDTFFCVYYLVFLSWVCKQHLYKNIQLKVFVDVVGFREKLMIFLDLTVIFLWIEEVIVRRSDHRKQIRKGKKGEEGKFYFRSMYNSAPRNLDSPLQHLT